MKFRTCYGCGVVVDLDAVPTYNTQRATPGKSCPVCHTAFDQTALDHRAVTEGETFGRDEIRATHQARLDAWIAGSDQPTSLENGVPTPGAEE